MDELINIPTKVKERSDPNFVWAEDPSIREAQSGIRVKNLLSYPPFSSRTAHPRSTAFSKSTNQQQQQQQQQLYSP